MRVTGTKVRRATALAVVLLAVGAGVAAAHGTSYSTATSFGFAADPDQVFGQVGSPNAGCVTGRRVKLFLRRRGGDRRIARARSGSTGQWTITRNLRNGKRYYAKVARKDIGPAGHDHICRAYRTTALRFPSGTA